MDKGDQPKKLKSLHPKKCLHPILHTSKPSSVGENKGVSTFRFPYFVLLFPTPSITNRGYQLCRHFLLKNITQCCQHFCLFLQASVPFIFCFPPFLLPSSCNQYLLGSHPLYPLYSAYSSDV